jgi:hypothetical protein
MLDSTTDIAGANRHLAGLHDSWKTTGFFGRLTPQDMYKLFMAGPFHSQVRQLFKCADNFFPEDQSLAELGKIHLRGGTKAALIKACKDTHDPPLETDPARAARDTFDAFDDDGHETAASALFQMMFKQKKKPASASTPAVGAHSKEAQAQFEAAVTERVCERKVCQVHRQPMIGAAARGGLMLPPRVAGPGHASVLMCDKSCSCSGHAQTVRPVRAAAGPKSSQLAVYISCNFDSKNGKINPSQQLLAEAQGIMLCDPSIAVHLLGYVGATASTCEAPPEKKMLLIEVKPDERWQRRAVHYIQLVRQLAILELRTCMSATIGQSPPLPGSKSHRQQRTGYTMRHADCPSRVNFVFRGSTTVAKTCSRCNKQLVYTDLRECSSREQDGLDCGKGHVLQSGIYASTAVTEHQGHRPMGNESVRAVSKLQTPDAARVLGDVDEYNLSPSTALAMLQKKANVTVSPADVRNGVHRAAELSPASSQDPKTPKAMLTVLDADADSTYISVSSILKAGATTAASETKKLVIVKLPNGRKYDASVAYERASTDTSWCVAKWLCDPSVGPPLDSWTELHGGDDDVKLESGTVLRNEMVLWAKKQELQRASRCMQFGAFDCTHKVSSAASVFLAWVFKDAENKTVNAMNGMLLNESACNFRNLVQFALPVFYGAAVTQCYATALDGDANEHSAVDPFTTNGVSQETAINMLADAVETVSSGSAMAVNGHCRILCYWHAVTKPFLTVISKCTNPGDEDRSIAWAVYNWLWRILINSETAAELGAGHARLQRALWGGKVKVQQNQLTITPPAVSKRGKSKKTSNSKTSYVVGSFKRFSSCGSMHTVVVQWKGYEDETEENMNKLYQDLGAGEFKRFMFSAGLTFPPLWTPPAGTQTTVAFRDSTIFERMLLFLDTIWPKRIHLATVYRRGLLSLGGRTSGMAEGYFRVVKYCNGNHVGGNTKLHRFVESMVKLQARRVQAAEAVQGKKRLRVQASSKTIPAALLASLSKRLVEHCVHLLEVEFLAAFGKHSGGNTPKYGCQLRTHQGETVWQIQTMHRSCPVGPDEHDEPCRTRVVRRDGSGHLQCTCNYYEEFGIVCRHMLLVLDGDITYDMMHYRWWSQTHFGELDHMLWARMFVEPRPPGPVAPELSKSEVTGGIPPRASAVESIPDCWYKAGDTAGASFIEITTCTDIAAGHHLPHRGAPAPDASGRMGHETAQSDFAAGAVGGDEDDAGIVTQCSDTGFRTDTAEIIQFDGQDIDEREAYRARNLIKVSMEAATAMVQTGQSTTYVNKLMTMIAGIGELNEAFTLEVGLDHVFSHPLCYINLPQRSAPDARGNTFHRFKAAYEMGQCKPQKRTGPPLNGASNRKRGPTSMCHSSGFGGGGSPGTNLDAGSDDDGDSTCGQPFDRVLGEDCNHVLQYDCLAWQTTPGSDSRTWYFLCNNTWASHRALNDRYGRGGHFVAVANLQLTHTWKVDCERAVNPELRPDGLNCRYCTKAQHATNMPGQTP